MLSGVEACAVSNSVMLTALNLAVIYMFYPNRTEIHP